MHKQGRLATGGPLRMRGHNFTQDRDGAQLTYADVKTNNSWPDRLAESD